MADKILGILPKFWKTPKNPTSTRTYPIGSSSWWNNFLFGAGFTTKSKATVNFVTAQAIPAYFRAVTLLSESMASLPWDVYLDDGEKITVAANDPVRNLLKGRPSQLYSDFSFREALQRTLMLRGDGFVIIHRNANGNPVDLEIWTGDKPDIFDVNGTSFYKFLDRKAITHWDVIHLKGWTTDGINGNDSLRIAREALGQAISQIEYGATFYGNGAHVSGVVETDKVLNENQKQALKSSITKSSGTDNVGDVMLLEAGLKYKHIGINPVDADLAEGRRLSTEDVANITGVPVFLLNNLERATFSNIEHLDRTFVQYTLRMHCKRWESEFSTKLFKRNEWGRKKIKFNLDGLLRGDTESRAKFYNSLFMVGALSPNDIRKMEKMNPYDGGDEYYTPLNMADNQESNED